MSQKPTAEEIEKMTPMLRQFFELKSQCPDAVLLFRMGDFYELFGEDAEEIAPKLELVLTSRERGDKNKIPFCGVPHHSAKNYWLKLLKMGYRVAIADQVEEPQEGKGLVKREIVQVLTPACIDELEGLQADEPNYLMAMHEDPKTKKWSVALVDVSTGEFRLGNLSSVQELIELISKQRPRELLLRRFLIEEWQSRFENQQNEFLWSELSEAALRDPRAASVALNDRFAVSSLSELDCGQVAGGIELVYAIFEYFSTIKASVSQFRTIRRLREPDSLLIDATACRDLELFETVRRRERLGSLFHELNSCRTPMGARFLRAQLQAPLMDSKKIERRLDAVSLLIGKAEFLENVRDQLHACPDLERLTTRALNHKAHPQELNYLRETLLKAKDLSFRLKTLEKKNNCLFSEIDKGLRLFAEPLKLLEKALEPGASSLGTDLSVIRCGYDSGFDEVRELATHGEKKLRDYEQSLRDKTGISSLKIKSHKTFGLLIEVTKANLSRVPKDFIRRQTMVNNERFMTDELVALDEELSHAREQAIVLEREIYANVIERLSSFKESLYEIAECLGTLDFLHSLAWVAKKGHWSRPKTSSDRSLSLQACRHPVVERFVGVGNFTANNMHVAKGESCLLITGPNMAGKSTVMRQTALAVLLHQIGSYLPARSASLPIYDRIFTRVGAADDLSRGQSTFMVEMSEAANILRSVTNRSLVILDEVGRGTSSQDGLAIAAAILESLSQNRACTTLFATHYHELVNLADSLDGVRNVQIEVIEQDGQIRFTHRLCDGASGSSYGIEVAKLAGIPESVIERAQQFLTKPEFIDKPKLLQSNSDVKECVLSERLGAQASELPLEKRGLASELETEKPSTASKSPFEREELQVIKRLRSVDCYRLTPLQALNLLDELKAGLSKADSIDLFKDSRY